MVKSDGGTESFKSHLGFDEVDLCSNTISLGMLNLGAEPSCEVTLKIQQLTQGWPWARFILFQSEASYLA